ncbi:MAG: polysaccharide deacetylase family protein, partial [Burkholderiales bacterium]|nr:polysaccharide deacetylase family protein [Burkholderiales bacterium]
MTTHRPPDVVVTVDVEDFFEPRPPFDTYCAQVGSEAWGVPRIMDILEQHGGRGTFFVDVYNRRTVSEDLIAECVREIDARGHEVGLHTHPAFPVGKRGYGMAQTMKAHSLAEQTAFVADGVAMIER